LLPCEDGLILVNLCQRDRTRTCMVTSLTFVFPAKGVMNEASSASHSVYHVRDIPNLPPLSNVRVFPRLSPSPVLRINLDLLPKSFSSYPLRPIYGLLPLRSQDEIRTRMSDIFKFAYVYYKQ
jgi:hypothetical protein